MFRRLYSRNTCRNVTFSFSFLHGLFFRLQRHTQCKCDQHARALYQKRREEHAQKQEQRHARRIWLHLAFATQPIQKQENKSNRNQNGGGHSVFNGNHLPSVLRVQLDLCLVRTRETTTETRHSNRRLILPRAKSKPR